MKRGLCLVVLTLCLLVCFSVVRGVEPQQPSIQSKHVLILHSYHKGYPWTDNTQAGIESVLKDSKGNIFVNVEFMDTKRVGDKNLFNRLLQQYRSKFDSIKFNLIIVSDNDAMNFALRYKDVLFPHVPVVFCGVNALNEVMQKKVPLVTGVVEHYDINATLEIALKFHPATKEVIAVNNATPIGAVKKQLFKEAMQSTGRGLKSTIIDDPTIEDFEKLIKEKGKDRMVFLLGSFKDKSGVIVPIEVSTPILARYDVPVYAVIEHYLGYGIIGGKLISGHNQGKLAAQMGLKILQGETVERVPMERKSPNQFMFDYNQMARFNIKQEALPEGSIVVNAPKVTHKQKELPVQNNTQKNTVVWAVIAILICVGGMAALFAIYVRSRRSSNDTLDKPSADTEKRIEARTEELMRTNADLRTEIAEMKIAEDSLSESQLKYLKLFQQAPSPIFIIDEAACISDCNTKMLEFLECSLDEVRAMEAFKLVPGDVFAELSALPEQTTVIRSFETECVVHGKAKRLLVNLAPVVLSGKWFVYGVGQEITKTSVPVSRNQESIEILAAGIAHDFNNLLLIILGNISLVKTGLNQEEKAFERLTEAERASMLAKDLIQQLITFSKGGKLSKHVMVVTPLIMEITRATLNNTNIKGKYIMSDDLFPVAIDEDQIRQVIQIILRNAREAMPKGGTITLTFENVRVARKDHISLQEGDYVRISFQDEGSGIRKEHLERIFDPYFTTKDIGSQKGVGLGLAIAYSIIRKHGGHIVVESSVGRGTTFHIYLPVYGKEMGAGKEPKEILHEPAKRKGKILVMDDAKSVWDVTEAMLNYIGYDAEFARDGREAIELYRESKQSGEPFNAVILDLTVQGGMEGKEAIQLLRTIDPHIRAIISSEYSGDPIMSEYQEYGFKAAILKPYNMRELEEILERLIHVHD